MPSAHPAVPGNIAGELAPLSSPRLKTTTVGPISQPHILTGGPHPSGLKRTHARTVSLRRLKAYFVFTPSTWQPRAG